MKYWYTKELNTSFIEALDDVEISLKAQGFWVLTRIDMKQAMKTKLDKDIEEYMIYWACNPALAFEALWEDYEIGLVLPCNVIIYKKDWKVFVLAIIAKTWIWFIENEKIQKIAIRADEKLKKAIDNI